MSEVIRVFSTTTIEGIKLTEMQARKCYALSKMTVVNEEYEADRYNWMPFAEFIDFIGKVAEFKFEHTEIAAEPLSKRLEYTFDALFEIINAERSEVVKKQLDVSESDDDY